LLYQKILSKNHDITKRSLKRLLKTMSLKKVKPKINYLETNDLVLPAFNTIYLISLKAWLQNAIYIFVGDKATFNANRKTILINLLSELSGFSKEMIWHTPELYEFIDSIEADDIPIKDNQDFMFILKSEKKISFEGIVNNKTINTIAYLTPRIYLLNDVMTVNDVIACIEYHYSFNNIGITKRKTAIPKPAKFKKKN
jgi:hypothetical protein